MKEDFGDLHTVLLDKEIVNNPISFPDPLLLNKRAAELNIPKTAEVDTVNFHSYLRARAIKNLVDKGIYKEQMMTSMEYSIYTAVPGQDEITQIQAEIDKFAQREPECYQFLIDVEELKLTLKVINDSYTKKGFEAHLKAVRQLHKWKGQQGNGKISLMLQAVEKEALLYCWHEVKRGTGFSDQILSR